MNCWILNDFKNYFNTFFRCRSILRIATIILVFNLVKAGLVVSTVVDFPLAFNRTQTLGENHVVGAISCRQGRESKYPHVSIRTKTIYLTINFSLHM